MEIPQNSGIDWGDFHQVPSLTKEVLAVCICWEGDCRGGGARVLATDRIPMLQWIASPHTWQHSVDSALVCFFFLRHEEIGERKWRWSGSYFIVYQWKLPRVEYLSLWWTWYFKGKAELWDEEHSYILGILPSRQRSPIRVQNHGCLRRLLHEGKDCNSCVLFPVIAKRRNYMVRIWTKMINKLLAYGESLRKTRVISVSF